MKRFRKLSPKLMHRLFGLIVCFGVCAMLLPLPMAPLPSNSTGKDLSQPFPCQNRPCGCRSAEQCWKKCCCFDNSQKIAWAKAHNVPVPDYVAAAARDEKVTSTEVCSLPANPSRAGKSMKSQRGCSRCNTTSVGGKVIASSNPCLSRGVARATESASPENNCNTDKTATPEAALPKASSSKWMTAVSSAECQGQGPHFYCSIVLVMPGSQVLTPPIPPLIEVFSLESERMSSSSLRPPVPPPKIDVNSAAA